MAFDLSTARPVNDSTQHPQRKRFDITTARPVEPQPSVTAAGQQPDVPVPDKTPGLFDISRQLSGGLVEPVLTLGSAGVGEVAGGLTGLGTLGVTAAGRALGLTDVDPAEAAEAVRRGVSERLTYQPRTAGAQLATQTLTTSAVPAAAAIQKSTELAGEAGNAVGGPAAGAVASAVPTAIAQYLGVRIPGVRGSGALDPSKRGRTAALPKTKTTDPVNDLAARRAEEIKADSTSGEVAPYRLSDNWRGVEKDRVAQNAIKQGFDKSIVSAIKRASPEDRQRMVRMLGIRQRGHNNARYSMDNRASDVAGDSLMQRVRHVRLVNQNAGRQLDAVAKALKGKPVDYRAPVDEFLARLREMGVTMDRRLKPLFAGSDIEGVDAAERVVRNIVARMRDTRAPDAYDLHRLKRYIDEQVTYGKSKDGLGGRTERILKSLRADLDSALDTNFPEYDRVNTAYADTVNALDALQDASGSKVNFYGDNADKAVGTVLRRLMSNTQSRVNLMDATADLETVAAKYGANFSDDLKTQMLFADELDKRFGATARTSLQGEMQKSINTLANVASGQQSTTGATFDFMRGGLNKVRGINDQNAFIAMRELLRR
ncbi:hypothetical protein [Microbulbifer discodermiae]|uniref:hypothetical protein n=1 Tax=Microbulbifer sp. 2201CG32-9 TaxID=3232309 RepID=UPI00345C1493